MHHVRNLFKIKAQKASGTYLDAIPAHKSQPEDDVVAQELAARSLFAQGGSELDPGRPGVDALALLAQGDARELQERLGLLASRELGKLEAAHGGLRGSAGFQPGLVLLGPGRGGKGLFILGRLEGCLGVVSV